MASFDELKALALKLKNELARRAADVPEIVVQQLVQHFPGISPDLLRQQWVPIPARYLEEELRKRAATVPQIESISLQCVRGHFLLTIDTKAGPLAHKTTLELIPREFALDRQRRSILLVANPDVQVEGRNTFGRASAWLAEATVVRAIKSESVAQKVAEASEGAVGLDWPRIVVHPDRIPQLKTILEYNVLGYTLLDVLTFGPLRVEQDYAYLKVDLASRKGEDRDKVTG
jgi:hypothetical protein